MSIRQRFSAPGAALLACLAAAVLLPSLPGCGSTISDRVVTRIELTQATRRFGARQALFIDARPGEDYQQGHIRGAINLRLGDLSFTQRDSRLSGRSPLIVYGQDPGSATAVALAKRLLELEYEGVEYFEPGYAAWRSAGLPTESTEGD